MKHELRTPLKPLQSGQIWQMEASNLQIELVGKTLVHYKLHKGTTKRTPISLSGKKVLEQYLKQNKAVLVQG
jgi:hypothetical protein